MKPEISVLLPSLRPELLSRTVKEFSETNSDVNYEIIVVSPFEVKTDRVIWVKEDKSEGSVVATNRAYTNSRGDYVMYFSDDVSPTKDCLKNMLSFMKTKKTPFVGAFKMINPNGKEIGPFGAYKKLYACYGCLNVETVLQLGGVFSSIFEYSWCDIDLSLRCWLTNGKVEICQDASVMPRQINDDIYKAHRGSSWDRDVEAFLNKWHSIYGNGIPREQGTVNRRLN